MKTQIHVKKIKETETGGTPTFMDEPVTFRLHDGCRFLCNNNYGEEIDVINSTPVKEKEITPNNDFDSESSNSLIDNPPF